jgi:hypothetical protein
MGLRTPAPEAFCYVRIVKEIDDIQEVKTQGKVQQQSTLASTPMGQAGQKSAERAGALPGRSWSTAAWREKGSGWREFFLGRKRREGKKQDSSIAGSKTGNCSYAGPGRRGGAATRAAIQICPCASGLRRLHVPSSRAGPADPRHNLISQYFLPAAIRARGREAFSACLRPRHRRCVHPVERHPRRL